jgi:zinc/manganese transport system permease protein
VLWAGVAVAYAAPRLPASFAIMAVATLLYLVAALVAWRRRRRHTGVRATPARSLPNPATGA